ncbi:MAG: helix-turn-helix transcriptional regulator [Catenulispora sp.]|nr:helix-turn-helix transcriptional regulator [Catenulispora sp.]
MSEIRFAATDVAEIRFAVSPLWETVRSLFVLADPGRYFLHVPWVRRARVLAQDPELAAHVRLLRRVARPGLYLPDFLTPPAPGPLADFEEELLTVAATPEHVIAADLAAVTRLGAADPGLEPLGPKLSPDLLPDLLQAVRAWHNAAILPDWPRMRALLEADIAFRARQVAEGGVRRLFDTLHPTVRWAGDRVIADDPWHLEIDVGGRGLPLMPSVFVDRRVLWTVRAESPPAAIYPVRAAATLWERRREPVNGLAQAFGKTRADLLALVRDPATTTELARRLELSPPTVSQHLHALLAAGLVARSPTGRTVLYFVTAEGAALLRVNGLEVGGA